jgi:hypothetical protein
MVFSLKKAMKTTIKGPRENFVFLAVSAWRFEGKKSPFQAIFGGFMREAQQTARHRISAKRLAHIFTNAPWYGIVSYHE